MEIEIDNYGDKFEFGKVWYEVTGTVIHHVEPEDVGIGSYEYHGSREYQTDIAYYSEYSKAEFLNISIVYRDTGEEVKEPSTYLLEAAKETLFNVTQQKAEEEASRCYE